MFTYIAKSKKGFTLIEMLIVVALIGILVAISIPIFSSQLSKAREAACTANRESLRREIVYAAMLDEAEPSDYTPEKIKENGYVCPAGGDITAAYDASADYYTVTCSEHGSGGGTPPITSAAGIAQLMQTDAVKDFFDKLGNYYTDGKTSSFNSADPALAGKYPELRAQLDKMLPVNGTSYDFRIYKKSGTKYMVYVYDATGKTVNDPVTVKAYEYDLSNPSSPVIDDNYDEKQVRLVSYRSMIDKTSTESFLGLQAGVTWNKRTP